MLQPFEIFFLRKKFCNNSIVSEVVFGYNKLNNPFELPKNVLPKNVILLLKENSN